MVRTISQNVPMCPICAALMHKRHYGEHLYFICGDCKSIWRVLMGGTAEVEVVVSNDDIVYGLIEGDKNGRK